MENDEQSQLHRNDSNTYTNTINNIFRFSEKYRNAFQFIRKHFDAQT